MWNKVIAGLALAATLLSTGSPFQGSQDSRQEEARGQLGWLIGDWVGEGFGGKVQETWLKPEGGAMLGMFRHIADGKPEFYELMTITEVGEELHMALKHFDADLVGWEAKDKSLQWPGMLIDEGSVQFGPVLYERGKKDTLEIWVELGEDKTEHLVMHRARP